MVHVEEKLVKDSTRLIDILIINGREEEATSAVDKLKKFAQEHEVSDRLKQAIDAALEKKPLAEPTENETEKNQNDSSTGSVGKLWTPPKNPDPSKILEEAMADRSSGDFQQALAKHLWYHQNVLRIQPNQKDARVSCALNQWRELGEKYPSALDKMREIRDAVELKIRDKNRVRVKLQDFSDFKALNCALQEQHLTAKLFLWVDKVDAEDAQRIYLDAEEALVKQGEYGVCGKYVDPKLIGLLCIFYCLLYTSPSPRDATLSRMPSSA